MRPNILLITTDEQRYDTIAGMGNDFKITPNLDSLLSESYCFTNAYSPNPVCMAARHNILTGLTAKYHGFDCNYFEDNPKVIPYDIPTLPQLLSDAGYAAIGVGKMHFQPCKRHNGFTKMELMEEIPRYLQDDDYAQYLQENGYGDIQSIHGVRHLLYMLPQQSLIEEEHHGSSWVRKRTIHHIKENSGKRPFFIWSSFIAPHPPLDVPEGWADLYKGKELPPISESITPISAIACENKYIVDYPNENYLRRARELYYASISFVDYNIGKIIQCLKDIGEYENTLIIFTSDHGEMLGDLGTFQKSIPYDASSKVPFLMHCPNQKQGKIEEKFVDLNDILPTVLDMANVQYPKPEILPGESILKENGVKNRDVQYMEHGNGSKRWISLRDKRYKYNYYFGGGIEELFDMQKDPKETCNLLYQDPSSELLKIKSQMKEKLTEMEKRYGLEGYVKNGKLIELEKYEPHFYRNSTLPMFPQKEKKIYITLEEEIKRAIEKEPVVRLEELDWQYYEERNLLHLDIG